jgi:hypothetical protein
LSGLAHKSPSIRVVAALLELSRPECGTVVGTRRPAGCEVCREVPCL